MITIAILTTISIWWSLVKTGGKAVLWALKWIIIISTFIGLIIPVFLGVLLTMCMASCIAWMVDIISATVTKTEPKLDRLPFDLKRNWNRLINSINRRAEKQEKKQTSRNNGIYVIVGRDLKKLTPVKPSKRHITLDEMMLFDLLMED